MGKASYFNINSRTAFSISSSQWALQSQYHFTDEESDVFSNKIIYPKPSQPAAQQGRNVIQTSSRLVSDPVGRFKWKIFYYLFLQNLLPLPPFHTFFFFFFFEPHRYCFSFWDLQGMLLHLLSWDAVNEICFSEL